MTKQKLSEAQLGLLTYIHTEQVNANNLLETGAYTGGYARDGFIYALPYGRGYSKTTLRKLVEYGLVETGTIFYMARLTDAGRGALGLTDEPVTPEPESDAADLELAELLLVDYRAENEHLAERITELEAENAALKAAIAQTKAVQDEPAPSLPDEPTCNQCGSVMSYGSCYECAMRCDYESSFAGSPCDNCGRTLQEDGGCYYCNRFYG